ncbi:MAG: trypsin-like peptidase domain-containing protein [Candidatus Marinimicrobia bacterium]|nr:trypsin-like peptidase domain-containing protein [Candidatus Neomarinimicrobiota bacterium]MCF7839158.1 trypsin-like peptidase domain-containing protein [Candidatus Neomarinimicrobiota bacterium]MCF7903421.1 trypsin-like peptidase domain-containing protein [Candidatus Neomarinimicrobiota bacterium]
MIKKISVLLFTVTIAMLAFTLTLHEIRRWKFMDSVSAADLGNQQNLPVEPASQQSLPAKDINESRQTVLTRAIQKVAPAVVGITVHSIRITSSPFANDPFFRMLLPEWYSQKVESLGSGFIYNPEGYVITNAHVAEGATEITVTLAGGDQYPGELVGIDRKTDVALIKIKADRKFPTVELGNSDNILLGEWVVALGNPFGLFSESREPIATLGIISSMHMDFGIQRSGRLYQDMIQTDASINSGNSGGPLVTADGRVVGINTFIFTGGGQSAGSIGISFAMPINAAVAIIEELRETGFIDRTYTTGLSIQNIDNYLAYVLNVKPNSGVIVVDVENGSPAEKAGLEVGDIVIGIDEQRVRTTSDIFNYIRERDLRRGDHVDLQVIRDGKRKNFRVTLESK